MSAGPSSTTSSEPPEPSGEKSTELPPRFPKQKRRSRAPEDADEEDLAEDETTLLSALLQSVAKRKQKRKKAPSERPPIYRFLPRADAGEPVDPSGQGASPPGVTAAVALPKFTPRVIAGELGVWDWRRIPHIRGILCSALAAALALAAFLAGRYTAPRPVAANRIPEAVRAAPLPPDFSDRLVAAMAADHAGDLGTALRIIDALAKGTEPDPALWAYQATLRTRLGYTDDVEADLRRWLASNPSPEATATFNTARGFNFARRREFDQAITCYAAVTQTDPFDTANLLHWAETLRRKGSPAEAVDKFQEALARLPATASPYANAQRDYIAYERRLSQVENGREADLEPELDKQLTVPAPSGYWLLTAAAAALQKGDMPASVDALKKAQATLPPEQFGILLGDYFFHSFAYHPEMNAFLVSSTPGQLQARRLSMDYFLDP